MDTETQQDKGSRNEASASLPRTTGSAGFRPLVKGDVVQRGDVFVDAGKRFEMSNQGVVLGVRVLGQRITKDNGGFFRPMPNAKH